MARPTKYKAEYCQKLIRFFSTEPYEDRKLPHYKGRGKNRELVWTDYKRMANKLPTLVGFAKHIKVCVATLYNWIDSEHSSFQQKFLDAFTQAKRMQKDFIIQNGLQGCYNPLFAKFVAVNLTDMRDKQEREHGVTDALAELIKEICSGGSGLPIQE